MLNRWITMSAVALIAASGAMAQEAKTLKVGDKAPALSVEDWVKGKKVEKFESGKVYVVEFWATWCGPCIEGIPHLTELQKEYKDKKVTILSIASSERGADNNSKLKGVENFVKKQGEKMGYTVGYDSDRSMSKDWMTPAGRSTIPSAFLVGSDGKIAWIGHPAQGLDESLKKAVEANKKLGAAHSEPTTVASNNSKDSKTMTSSDHASSSQSNSSSQSSSQKDSKHSSDSKKSSDSQKKTESGSESTKDPR